MIGTNPRDSRMRVLIAGGGVAALEAAVALRALAAERASVVVVAPDREFVYRPLSVAQPFRVEDVRAFPLDLLVEDAGARLCEDTVVSIDPDRHSIRAGSGDELAYDVALLALGARPTVAVEGALTFAGPQSVGALAGLLDEAVAGEIRSIAFAMPAGVSWPLPLYELALLTGTYLADHGTRGVELMIVTPEEAPLALFGLAASEAIRELLELRSIDIRTHVTPLRFRGGKLNAVPGVEQEVDRVVALPRLEGPRFPGIGHDSEGFVSTDEHGRVRGAIDVYAAGDMTRFPLKQGGIATQQADAAAASIAAAAGADVMPAPFRPVLRGLLLTGMVSRFLRAEPGTSASAVDTEPLWWPPGKIVGRYLAPYLADRLGLSEQPVSEHAVEVDVELDRQTAAPQARTPA
jgi:sulfide:quinone oxidoreductase